MDEYDEIKDNLRHWLSRPPVKEKGRLLAEQDVPGDHGIIHRP